MTVSEQIIEVLNYICEKVGLAIDWTVVFANENVIPYVELLCGKFITYEIATSAATMVVCIIFCIICGILAKAIHKNKEFGVEHYTYIGVDYFGRYMCYGIIAAVFFIATIAFTAEAFDIITCVTFPEKILFEEIKEIYNNMSN